MSLFFSALRLVLTRSLANWKLLSCVAIGVIVAVALVAGTALYANTLSDLGLARALREKPIELLDVNVYLPNRPINAADEEENQGVIRNHVYENIGALIRQEEQYIRTPTFQAGWADRPLPPVPNRPTGHFQVFTNLGQHITLLDGRLPDPFPAGLNPAQLLDPHLEIEALIGRQTAEVIRVSVGDRLIVIYDSGEDATRLTIRLTGIIDPIDPEAEFWFLNQSVFYEEPPPDPITGLPAPPIIPLFIPEQTLYEGIGRLLPNLTANYNWYYYVDVAEITSVNATATKESLRRMRAQLVSELPLSSALTTLDGVITTHERKLLFTQLPLFLLVFQIVGIILYYVATVANMVVDQQAGEIALLRSRGAKRLHILGIYFTEGLLISAFGGAVGPFLGAAVFTLLGRVGPFIPLTGGGLLPIRFSAMVFTLAAATAALCLIALLFAAMRATRIGLVAQRQRASRPPRAPFWQRYYLDIVLLLVGGALYWQIRQRETFASQEFLGEMNVDFLALATPVLFMLAGAIAFLRLFPLILTLASWLMRYTHNTAVILSLRYMARNPMHYGRLVLLLTMATSVGMFAASFLGTLERSYDERARYATGGDIWLGRLDEYRLRKSTLEESYGGIPGVEAATVGLRTYGTMGVLSNSADFTLLAIDPTTFADVAWFRDDFAEKSLPELMAVLAEDRPAESSLLLPDGAERIGIWAYPVGEHIGLTLTVRIKDGDGLYSDLELGMPTTEKWHYLETDLVRLSTGKLLTSPLTLHAIYAHIKPVDTQQREFPEAVYLDNLQVSGSSLPEPIIIEDFEDVSDWGTPVTGMSRGRPVGDFLSRAWVQVHDGAASGKFFWRATSSFGNRGIFPNLDERPLTVIASQSLLDGIGWSVGTSATFRLPGQLVPVEIKDVVDMFPTLDPEAGAFALVNIDRLTAIRALALDSKVAFYPSEVWLKVTEDEEQREATIETLGSMRYRAEEFRDRETMLVESREDPLGAAGWGGILLIAFLGVILVSGLGFVVFAYLSARGRQLEFAILRTLGFSLRQIIGLICLEQVFVVGSGIGIGTLLGLQLSSVMTPFLQLTEMGRRVLPPFIPAIDWPTVGIAYIILAVAFMLTISLVILFFSRVAIHRALRIGE